MLLASSSIPPSIILPAEDLGPVARAIGDLAADFGRLSEGALATNRRLQELPLDHFMAMGYDMSKFSTPEGL